MFRRGAPACGRRQRQSASSRYGPVGRFDRLYEPVPSVTSLRTKPVAVCMAVTVTPGSTAPLSSVTRPLNCAVDSCAHATGAKRETVNALASVLGSCVMACPSTQEKPIAKIVGWLLLLRWLRTPAGIPTAASAAGTRHCRCTKACRTGRCFHWSCTTHSSHD